MIKDWNRSEVFGPTVFHFKNSLRPFVFVQMDNFEDIFIDINEWVAYTFDDLEFEGLNFYTKEDDDVFKGVEVAGTLKEWL